MIVLLLEITLKMTGFIRNTVSLFLAAIVLIATSGFTVFSHSCHKAHTNEFSITTPDCGCEHNNQIADEAVHSCCGITESPAGETYEPEKCCDTESFLIKLDITFETHNILNKTHLSTADQPTVTAFELDIPSGEITHIIVCNNLPPPLSGKALHIFLNQLNIPFHTV